MQVGLLTEDHPEARAWVKEALTVAFPGLKLVCSDSLRAGLEAIERLCIAGVAPDIAVVDLGLPDGSGIELIKALRQRTPACLCIVATRFEDDNHLFSALRAGAGGYFLKQQPQAELIQLLRGIIRGEPPLSPAIARRLLAEFGPEPTTEPRIDCDSPRLTPREREVLCLLTKGYTLLKLGQLLGISRHTVAAHVKRIYEKLEISSRAEASREAMRLGLISH